MNDSICQLFLLVYDHREICLAVRIIVNVVNVSFSRSLAEVFADLNGNGKKHIVLVKKNSALKVSGVSDGVEINLSVNVVTSDGEGTVVEINNRRWQAENQFNVVIKSDSDSIIVSNN